MKCDFLCGLAVLCQRARSPLRKAHAVPVSASGHADDAVCRSQRRQQGGTHAAASQRNAEAGCVDLCAVHIQGDGAAAGAGFADIDLLAAADGVSGVAAGGEEFLLGEFGAPGGIVRLQTGGDAGVRRFIAAPVQGFCCQRGHPAGMGVEPGVGKGAVICQEDDAAGLVHGGENAGIHGVGVIGLRLGDIGGDIRAGVTALLLGDELQHIGAGEDGLRFEGLHGPVGGHLARNDSGYVAFHVHADDGADAGDPDVDLGYGGGRGGGRRFLRGAAPDGAGGGQEEGRQQAEQDAETFLHVAHLGVLSIGYAGS